MWALQPDTAGGPARFRPICVFPLSNWTEQNVWLYILARHIELAPLYRAAKRPVVMRNGLSIVVDDPARVRWRPGEEAARGPVRFRTLGRWSVTAAEPSQAATRTDVVAETSSPDPPSAAAASATPARSRTRSAKGYFLTEDVRATTR